MTSKLLTVNRSKSKINSLRIEVRKMNDKMQDLLQVLSDMRRKYATQLDISDNELNFIKKVFYKCHVNLFDKKY